MDLFLCLYDGKDSNPEGATVGRQSGELPGRERVEPTERGGETMVSASVTVSMKRTRTLNMFEYEIIDRTGKQWYNYRKKWRVSW